MHSQMGFICQKQKTLQCRKCKKEYFLYECSAIAKMHTSSEKFDMFAKTQVKENKPNWSEDNLK